MTARRPQIVVTNFAYPETLKRLSAIGNVDANPHRTVWPRSELHPPLGACGRNNGLHAGLRR